MTRSIITSILILCPAFASADTDIEKTTLSAIVLTKEGKMPDGALDINEDQPVMTPSQAIEYFHALAEAGVDHAIFNSVVMHIPGAFDLWAEQVVPAVEKMQVAGR